MQNGWIKLHRKLKEDPIYKNSKALHCWIECLLRASHSTSNYYLGRKQIELNSGQFIFGREEFGRSIGISGSTAWFWLERFKVDSMVDIKKTSKGCLCSIKKWKEYQEVDSNIDNKKTANKQQINTDKNDKNVKNDKNISTIVEEPTAPTEIEYISEEVDKTENKQIMGILMTFKGINPTLNFGHRTHRTAIKQMIKQFGYDKLKSLAQYAISIQGQKYAPTITTPYLLQQKIAELKIFYDKNNNSKILSI